MTTPDNRNKGGRPPYPPEERRKRLVLYLTQYELMELYHNAKLPARALPVIRRTMEEERG